MLASDNNQDQTVLMGLGSHSCPRTWSIIGPIWDAQIGLVLAWTWNHALDISECVNITLLDPLIFTYNRNIQSGKGAGNFHYLKL